ncbi:hypothetical protein ACTXT7_001661 [Hymenolepis weldensis]
MYAVCRELKNLKFWEEDKGVASRSHHQSGSNRQPMSPAMNSGSTPQLRTRNQNPPVVKKALPHSPTQHSDAISPMYQLPEFVNSPPKNLETSPKHESKLERLRREKYKCEQTWQLNKRLVNLNKRSHLRYDLDRSI